MKQDKIHKAAENRGEEKVRKENTRGGGCALQSRDGLKRAQSIELQKAR